MNWRNYLVTTPLMSFNVRAISEKDALYVATTPCKRNGGKPAQPTSTPAS